MENKPEQKLCEQQTEGRRAAQAPARVSIGLDRVPFSNISLMFETVL